MLTDIILFLPWNQFCYHINVLFVIMASLILKIPRPEYCNMLCYNWITRKVFFVKKFVSEMNQVQRIQYNVFDVAIQCRRQLKKVIILGYSWQSSSAMHVILKLLTSYSWICSCSSCVSLHSLGTYICT